MQTFAEDCSKYIQLHAKHARLAARMEVLRERIVPQLREGASSPRTLPYLLILQKRIRTLADWKDALQRQLMLWLKNDVQVKERMEQIGNAFPKAESEALTVQINKSYAAKLSA